jgi:integration host factor subunit beta
MKRSDLIAKLNEEFPDLKPAQVDAAVRSIFDEITETLAQGGRVEFRGFGTFSARIQKPRIGRNPKNGERVDVPEKQYPFFKGSKLLLARLNAADEASE